jgi:hypothetical protein
MFTAYKVKRREPLPVRNIGVVFQLSGQLSDTYEEDDDLCPEERYVKTIHGTITGWDTASKKRIVIGHMEASFVQVNNSVRDRQSPWCVFAME